MRVYQYEEALKNAIATWLEPKTYCSTSIFCRKKNTYITQLIEPTSTIEKHMFLYQFANKILPELEKMALTWQMFHAKTACIISDKEYFIAKITMILYTISIIAGCLMISEKPFQSQAANNTIGAILIGIPSATINAFFTYIQLRIRSPSENPRPNDTLAETRLSNPDAKKVRQLMAIRNSENYTGFTQYKHLNGLIENFRSIVNNFEYVYLEDDSTQPQHIEVQNIKQRLSTQLDLDYQRLVEHVLPKLDIIFQPNQDEHFFLLEV